MKIFSIQHQKDLIGPTEEPLKLCIEGFHYGEVSTPFRQLKQFESCCLRLYVLARVKAGAASFGGPGKHGCCGCIQYVRVNMG